MKKKREEKEVEERTKHVRDEEREKEQRLRIMMNTGAKH